VLGNRRIEEGFTLTNEDQQRILGASGRCGGTIAFAFVVVLVASACASRSRTPGADANPYEIPNDLLQTMRRSDLRFEPNNGQAEPDIKFISRAAGYAVFLKSTEAILRFPTANEDSEQPTQDANTVPPARHVLRMRLVGTKHQATPAGVRRLPGTVSYFIGDDPALWRTGIPTFGEVEYGEVYPGVELTFYGQKGRLKFDFVVAPGVDPNDIALHFEGADEIFVDGGSGDLMVSCAGKVARFGKPFVYQDTNGEPRTISGGYVLSGNEVRFQLGHYDTTKALVIDPVLIFSTLLGGSGIDSGSGIAVDADGNVYVTGDEQSLGFPLSPIPPATGSSRDAFLIKVDPSAASMSYSVYLGGAGIDDGQDIALDASGNVYLVGRTQSSNFPTVGNALPKSPSIDTFVAKIDPSASSLLYSTFLGGAQADEGEAIAIDSFRNIYVTGRTFSPDFPIKGNPFQASYRGAGDVFVSKFSGDPAPQLTYSTYLGGSATEFGLDIKTDQSDVPTVVGFSKSSDFPTAGEPFQPAHRGDADGFLARVNPDRDQPFQLEYSTFLGGSGMEYAWGIAFDVAGNAYVTGTTESLDLPTVTPLQADLEGPSDAFLAKVAPGKPPAEQLLYSTYWGGDKHDSGNGIAVDADGRPWIVGVTSSTNFRTVQPVQPDHGGSFDAFVTSIDTAGPPCAVRYSTYLGGSSSDRGNAIAVDAYGYVHITGDAGFPFGSGYPTVNPLQPYAGGTDAFISSLATSPLCDCQPRMACRRPTQGGAGLFHLMVSPRRILTWKWANGAQTSLGDFGNPTVDTNYALCVYDESAQGSARELVLSATGPAAGICSGQPCWKQTTAGFQYEDQKRTPHGLYDIGLTPGGSGQANIRVRGAGLNLQPVALPLKQSNKIIVQLVNSLGTCWEDSFGAPASINSAAEFRDVSD
jgi:hypothetical protein